MKLSLSPFKKYFSSTRKPRLTVKYILESTTNDGLRVLTERAWPSKFYGSESEILWLKDIAPSERLMDWYDYDPYKWLEFERQYLEELSANNHIPCFIKSYNSAPLITLLYSTTYDKLTHALILKKYLSKLIHGM